MGNTCSVNSDIELKSQIENNEVRYKLDQVELKYPVFYGVKGLRELSESRKNIEK